MPEHTWALRMRRDGLIHAGALRLRSIEVCALGDAVWLRGGDLAQELRGVLQALPAVERFDIGAGGMLMPAGKSVPVARLPDGPWMSIASALRLEAQTALLPASITLSLLLAGTVWAGLFLFRGSATHLTPLGLAYRAQVEGFRTHLAAATAEDVILDDGRTYLAYLPWAVSYGVGADWTRVTDEAYRRAGRSTVLAAGGYADRTGAFDLATLSGSDRTLIARHARFIPPDSGRSDGHSYVATGNYVN